ncbi:MAG: DUF3883 domain-containing protein, partial [Chloroflexi bacterium]|nr:DUF3883 domain-containing protein [Chloroflexota bacterium]
AMVCSRFGRAALRGGVFVDPYAERPYLFHLGLAVVERSADPACRALAHDEVLEYVLFGLKQEEGEPMVECPVERLLLLKGGSGIPAPALRFAASAGDLREMAKAHALEWIARPLAEERRRVLLESLPSHLDFVLRGYDYQDAELAAVRAKLTEKARDGDARARGEIAKIRERQRALMARREEALAALRREPELIAPGEVTFLAHALVVPSDDPEDRKRHDREVEAIAVRIAWVHEEANGAVVKDISTPELARAVSLTDHPGFDLLSRRPDGEEIAIEVKGRAGIGEVELSENEWVKACNLGERYWLYVVYDCASSHPRLLRVQDPFRSLVARAKGSVIIGEGDVFACAASE